MRHCASLTLASAGSFILFLILTKSEYNMWMHSDYLWIIRKSHLNFIRTQYPKQFWSDMSWQSLFTPSSKTKESTSSTLESVKALSRRSKKFDFLQYLAQGLTLGDRNTKAICYSNIPAGKVFAEQNDKYIKLVFQISSTEAPRIT